ncbi:MAG: alpha-amylase family glycosyl hydrolase [Bacteroidales bacterium]|nr:alpha-amylase family glycosyl hydrolase [Bacteroidales bacterium]
MKTIRIFLPAVLFFSLFLTQAQVITTNPVIPIINQAVEIIFDASQGNQGLMGYTGDVYAHTGVITNVSTSPTDWKYVKTNWGENTPETKLTRLDVNLYKLTITPNIRAYYNVPVSEQIQKMAFVFRSASQVGGSWLEGKDTGNADIYADVYDTVLSINRVSPTLNELILPEDQLIYIYAISPQADTMSTLHNGIFHKNIKGAQIYDTITPYVAGGYWIDNQILIRAKAGNEEVFDTINYKIIPSPTLAEIPEGMVDGINYLNDNSVILSLYAPNKQFAFVLGDFNDWTMSNTFYMNKTPDGKRFWIQIENLIAGKEYVYQYLVDGNIKIADPYSDKISNPWDDKYISSITYPNLISYPEGKTTDVASVLQTAQQPYSWEINDFSPPKTTDLVIYELLVRDFTSAHSYKALIDTIGYLKRLGVNAIELMPVNEFEGNISWGYNTSMYFAPDKYYGPKNMLKKFIDECHKQGIAVLMDIVLNHAYGQNPFVKLYWDNAENRPAADNPWFNQSSPNPVFSWGFDFNHESQDTKNFIDRVNRYWLSDYRFDGFRFDFTKGFTNKPGEGSGYDASRINILDRMADSIWAFKSNAIVILEHFADNSEEKILANHGMLLWGNLNYSYNEASMGYTANSDFSWIDYKRRSWDNPHVVGYMESHDEERLMYRHFKSGNTSIPSYNLKDTTNALQRMGMVASFFFTIPGPKMIWQFGEMGYDYSIDYNGRTGPKPVRWDYLQNYKRKYLYELYAALIDLKKRYDVFESTDYYHSLVGGPKKIVLSGSDMDVVVMANFGMTNSSILPGFTKTGMWFDYISGDSITVDNMANTHIIQPGEFYVYTSVKIPRPATLNTGIEYGIIHEKSDFNVFPNPTNSDAFIRLNLKKSQDIQLNIVDALGKEINSIYKGKLNAGLHHFTITNPLIPGLYLIYLQTSSGVETRKLIVQ